MKTVFIFILLLLCANQLSAQIGINTETVHASATLDINKEKNNAGMLLPRVTTAQKMAITNPAHGLFLYDTTKECISQNIGTEAAPHWICMKQNATRFFYMPSINIKTPALGGGSTNLYLEYINQFGTPMAKNPLAAANIPYYLNPQDLSYYITYYDPLVFSNVKIDVNGNATYTIIKKADYDSYMNVVFVVK